MKKMNPQQNSNRLKQLSDDSLAYESLIRQRYGHLIDYDNHLHNLIRRFDWRNAIERIETHPEEILPNQNHTNNVYNHNHATATATATTTTTATTTATVGISALTNTTNILTTICNSFRVHRPPPFQLIQKIVQIHPQLVTMSSSFVSGHYGNDDRTTMMFPLHALFHFFYCRRDNPDSDEKLLVQDVAMLFIDTNPNVLLDQLQHNGFLPLHILLGRESPRYQYGRPDHRDILFYPYRHMSSNYAAAYSNYNSNSVSVSASSSASASASGRTSTTTTTNESSHNNEIENQNDPFLNGNDDKLHFFKKMVLTNPQCLIICNKGGVSCLEMFWYKYCIVNNGTSYGNGLDDDDDRISDSDSNSDDEDHINEILIASPIIGSDSDDNHQQRRIRRRQQRRRRRRQLWQQRQFLLCPQSASEYYYQQHHDEQGNEEYYSSYASQKTMYTREIYPYLLIIIKAAFQATRMISMQTMDVGEIHAGSPIAAGATGNATASDDVTRDSKKIDNSSNTNNFQNEDESANEGDFQFLPLHALIGIPCVPIDMVQFALAAHGNHDLRTQDSNGNTPLHIAISTFSTGRIQTTNVKRRSVNDTLSIIQQILDMDPSLASIPNHAGYYPLFFAIQNGIIGWDDGLNDIIDAHANIIGCVDPTNNFHPFIYAAMCKDEHNLEDRSKGCSNSKSTNADNDRIDNLIDDQIDGRGMSYSAKQLDTTYRLLRKCPTLVFAGKRMQSRT